ncbi:nucleoside-diphosphate kinase [bacterium SCGC AG-212-C10]|nr:nucleoside-diphosphate kinase [bacterium SCGC AG-212-C10]
MERTLVLVKPDAMQRGLAGEILKRLESRGLKVVALKLTRPAEALLRAHYAEHEGKPFLAGLIEYMSSSPIIAAVFEGPNAIQAIRHTAGATNPVDKDRATPGSIRADFALQTGRNLIHASDTEPGSAEREIALWFAPDEIVPWPRESDRWVAENAWE